MLSVLDLGAVQIELSNWQHRIALQLCVAHCLCSLSSAMRCGEIVTYHKRNGFSGTY